MSYQPRVLRISEPVVPVGMDEKPKLDPSDPRVRKLVYSMYRDMLTNCNDEANDFLSQKNPDQVKQDLGVGPILESIIRQGSSGSGSSATATPAPPPPPASATPQTGGLAPPPPPPPLASGGHIPSVRLNSEVGPLPSKGPPMAIQGAMMKDKKPFTYTPGGIDLSEIRSPRMAKRIQMNAAAEGVTSVPTQSNPTTSPAQPHYLPPAALAAMQPQMPISVLPQGGFNPASLHRTHKPTDFAPNGETDYQNQFIPPPPPPPQRFAGPPNDTPPPLRFPPQSIQQQPLQQNQPEYRAPSPNVNVQTPPKSIASVMSQSFRAPAPAPPSGTPPLPQPVQQSTPQQPNFQSVPPPPQTRAQTVSQNIGSIYIPPLEPKQDQIRGQPQPAAATIATPDVRRNSFESETERDRSSSNTPQTPQLNKAPVPWMNSHNRMQNQVQNSPPYVGTANTPWGTVLSSGQGRTIPISIARDDKEEEVDNSPRPAPTRPPHFPGVRAVPFQIQHPVSNNSGENAVSNNEARTIPIQMEGNIQRIPPMGPPPHQMSQPGGGSAPFRRFGPASYNNPGNLYSQQAAQQEIFKQAAADIQSGINKMQMEDESARQEPIQSKSFRVLQKITDGVDEGSTLHNTTEPRFRGSNIPSRAFRTLQNNLPPQNPDTQEQAQTPSPQTPQRQGNSVTHTIKIRMPEAETIAQNEVQQEFQQQRLPPSQQTVQEPKKYMGGNIPSRSFKMLQAMTGESNVQGSAYGSDVGPDQSNINSSSETPADPNYPESETPSDQPLDSESYYYIPENFDPNFNWEGWDAYSYWYYWWYYANYWNAGGEYPEGWENYSEYPENEQPIPSPQCNIPSKSFRNLQKSVDEEMTANRANESPTTNVPQILIGGEKPGKKMNGNCDGSGLKCEKLRDWKLTRKENVETEGKRNEETDDESAIESDSYASSTLEGFVDEPETPSSEDDASTLTDENQPVVIEECFSEPESPFSNHSQNRLSTIDEMSENELSQTPIKGLSRVGINLLSEDEDPSESSSESESSADENSSASVIENKSGECDSSALLTTEHGNCDDDNSSSSEDEEMQDAEDDNNNAEQSTVVVRLPLQLSFSKSKSYRDIATVLVGNSEVETNGVSAPIVAKSLNGSMKSRGEIVSIRETSESSEESSESSNHDNVPVASYTIVISRTESAKNKSSAEGDKDKCEDETDTQVEAGELESEENVNNATELNIEANIKESAQNEKADEDIDFWGEIINKSTEPESSAPDLEKEIPQTPEDVDFWAVIESEENSAPKVGKLPEVNFWEKGEILTNRFNFIESHRSFELTDDYHREREKAMQLLVREGDDEDESLTMDPNGFELLERNETNGVENKVMIISELNAKACNAEWENSEEDDYGEFNQTEKGDGNEGDKRSHGEDTDGNKTSGRLPGIEERNSSSKSRKTPNGFRPVDSPASLSVSDETSDESSSRSSGTTIGKQEKSGNESDSCERNGELKKGLKETSREIREPQISPVPIKQIPQNVDSPPKPDMSDRVAKAESLLWRIEKFLQESLCLGSEDDSGFMTDFSRPISECETDYDAENEVMAAAAAQKKVASSTQISHEKVSTTMTTTSSTIKVVETMNKTNEEKVTLRNSAGTGRKALSYQRAKTHSRLFQLLQEECGREDEDEDEEDEMSNNDSPPPPVSAESLSNGMKLVEKIVAVEIESSVEDNGSKSSRSRLMTPLPIKTNFPGLDTNSTSSPSGSSGVLSPTSPAQRDQLLADIINEFHIRVNTDSTQQINPKRNPNFPSKIFKLLQEEFGEEFYDTFHRGDDLFSLPILSQQRSVQGNSSEIQVQEATSETKAEQRCIKKKIQTK